MRGNRMFVGRASGSEDVQNIKALKAIIPQ